LNTIDDLACDDGLFCNGAELCDPLLDCQAGSNPCPGQTCDESTDQCDSSLPPEPTFISLNPDTGSSVIDSPVTFTLDVGDGDGTQNIAEVKFVIKQGNGTGTTPDAIILWYTALKPDRIYMYNPEAGRWFWALMGSSTLMENNLCILDASQTIVTGDGPLMTINYNITPKVPFIETPLTEEKKIWLLIRDIDGNVVNNLHIGTWVVSNSCADNIDCDDGVFCNGFEVCTGGSCQPGSSPCNTPLICDETSQACVECISDQDCDDGVACTVDFCAPDGTCQSTLSDSLCDDGLFCNGIETCDELNDCQAGSSPCTGQLCDETIDLCVDCLTGLDCDDAIDCTLDSCETDGTCLNTPDDLFCDDGLFCNGEEVCDPLFDCQADSYPCTGQLCDETIDLCVDCLSGLDCDDGIFCNGSEACDLGTCYSGNDPCTPPLVCDEFSGTCLGCTIDSDCDDGINCTFDACETDGTCLNTIDDLGCDDGLFCNGAELCDPLLDCQAGSNPCPGQTCDEVNDQCEYTLPPEPTFISLTPDESVSMTNEPIELSLQVADGDGHENLSEMRFVIKEGSGTGNSSDAIVLWYTTYKPERIYMYNHTTNRYNWVVMGTSATLENNFCILDALYTSVAGTGDTLTLNLNLTPKEAFIAAPLNEDKQIWLLIRDNDGNVVNNLSIGTWAVTN
jgi:hypothetical protein